MLKISSSIEYAIRIMAHMAVKSEGMPLSAEKLANSENIPRDFVDQILQRLRRAGLVVSRRGAHGGYLLASRSKDISVGAVVRAVDEIVFEPVCEKYSVGDVQCSHTNSCGIRPVWRKLAGVVESYLDEVTLLELSENEPVVESRIAELFAARRRLSETP